MRGLVIGVMALTVALGSAHAESFPPNVARLIAIEETLNDECRDGDSNSATEKVCARRDQVVHQIRTAGYCWGQLADDEADSTFQLCVTSPTFDCAKASNFAERAICSDTDLMADDRLVAAHYKALLATRGDEARTEQRSTLKMRAACTTKSCVRDWYSKRLAAMSVEQ